MPYLLSSISGSYSLTVLCLAVVVLYHAPFGHNLKISAIMDRFNILMIQVLSLSQKKRFYPSEVTKPEGINAESHIS